MTKASNTLQEAKSKLKDEVIQWVKWFADSDIENHGHITESTVEIARVQNVNIHELYDSKHFLKIA